MNTIKGIDKKLFLFQEKHVKIRKTKTNPHFKSKYADINTILDEVLPVLNELKILVKQKTIYIDNIEYLETSLIDIEDGSSESSVMRMILQKDNEQGFGSSVTYKRRYALVTMLNLEQEDEDGNSASRSSQKHNLEKQKKAGLEKRRLAEKLEKVASCGDAEAVKALFSELTQEEKNLLGENIDSALEVYIKKANEVNVWTELFTSITK